MARTAIMPSRRGIRLAIGVPIVLVGGCFSVVTSRKHVHVERDGWVLDYSHKRFFCKVCTASLNYVRYDGEDIRAPWAAGRAPEHASVVLHTPVGELLFHSQEGRYRPWHSYWGDIPESDEEITPEELSRGYYNASATSTTTAPSASYGYRKRGTPAHWCFVEGGTEMRWLDPRMIDKLEW